MSLYDWTSKVALEAASYQMPSTLTLKTGGEKTRISTPATTPVAAAASTCTPTLAPNTATAAATTPPPHPLTTRRCSSASVGVQNPPASSSFCSAETCQASTAEGDKG